MSGRASVSTTYIAREGEIQEPGGDILTLQPGDIVYAKVPIDKWFGAEQLTAPAGRLFVFYGFTHPGRGTVYGTFDAEDGARVQAHRMVRLWEIPLYRAYPGLMLACWPVRIEVGELEMPEE